MRPPLLRWSTGRASSFEVSPRLPASVSTVSPGAASTAAKKRSANASISSCASGAPRPCSASPRSSTCSPAFRRHAPSSRACPRAPHAAAPRTPRPAAGSVPPPRLREPRCRVPPCGLGRIADRAPQRGRERLPPAMLADVRDVRVHGGARVVAVVASAAARHVAVAVERLVDTGARGAVIGGAAGAVVAVAVAVGRALGRRPRVRGGTRVARSSQLERIAKTGPGNKFRRTKLSALRGYIAKRAAKMNYGELIAARPRARHGPVEGAIKNIMGRRMDHGGMRWIKERVEAVLQLRCIDVNGDWAAFVARVHDQARAKMIGHRRPRTTPDPTAAPSTRRATGGGGVTRLDLHPRQSSCVPG